jgi:hypothetical protein
MHARRRAQGAMGALCDEIGLPLPTNQARSHAELRPHAAALCIRVRGVIMGPGI